MAVTAVYGLFLLWHEPWFQTPLTAGELEIAFKGMDANQQVSNEEKQAIRSFFQPMMASRSTTST